MVPPAVAQTVVPPPVAVAPVVPVVVPPPVAVAPVPPVVRGAMQVAPQPVITNPPVASVAPPVVTVGAGQPAAPVVGQQTQHSTVLQQLAAVTVSAEQLSAALATAVPKKGKRCYKCGVVGHRSTDCKVDICVICEGPAHGDRQCHLLIAPKPQIRVYGYGHEELIFFEYSCTTSYKPKMENVSLASVVVTGGEMNIPGIVIQLQRLVPVEHFLWDVRRMGHNIFQV